jgi:hypothetical protein
MPQRNLVFFPGSTIGNLSADKALSLLQVMREEAKDDGALLIGVDLVKPAEILEPAYNDAAGVTADFNLNLLERLNREHDANFSLPSFEHEAVYDAENRRIEMRLVSLVKQRVRVAGEAFDLADANTRTNILSGSSNRWQKRRAFQYKRSGRIRIICSAFNTCRLPEFRPAYPSGTKSGGGAEPSPNKNFSISCSRNSRAAGSIGVNRFSLISMVWWATHCCQACAEICS